MGTDKNICVGVDPGMNGAMAVMELTPAGYTPLRVVDFNLPDYVETVKSLDKEKVLSFYIERVGFVRGDGGRSAFTFGFNAGSIFGVAFSLGFNPSYVSPLTWYRHFGLTKSGPRDKPSLELCRSAFPSVDLHLKKHDGRADAILIACYGGDKANAHRY